MITRLLPAMGAAPAGDRLARLQRSPNYRDGAFRNPVETSMTVNGSSWRMLRRQLFGKEQRVPSVPLPVIPLTSANFDTPPVSGLRVSWLGHSSTLVEIDGYRVLVDPIFGKRISPSQLVGPKRFHPPPLPFDELPALDAVIITHDHYDHLDAGFVRRFVTNSRQEATQWITTLGVGAHLERWGVPATRITELDWGDTAHVASLQMTAQPARHFSGRGVKRFATLWASWVIAGPAHRVFHSGDSGFFAAFEEIGAKHGPFDLAMIKIGAYDESWPDIHLDPEQAVRVHEMVRGGVLLPIHWGTFNLAFHAWSEPADRVVAAAAGAKVPLVMPRPGQQVEPANLPALDLWWRTTA